MTDSKLEGEILVKDLSLFLEKSKQGVNLVYQLHRELGGVFVDASFQDRKFPSLLYRARIHLDPPKLIQTEAQWDEHGFPYELETYTTDDEEVVVPLYRHEAGESMTKFLEDVAEYELQPDGDRFKYAPENVKESIERILQEINVLSEKLIEIKTRVGDKELRAIDVYFGEADMFSFLGDSADGAIAQYLRGIFWERGRLYTEVQVAAQSERQQALVAAENRAIERLENTFKTHNFKQGFVSTEVLV